MLKTYIEVAPEGDYMSLKSKGRKVGNAKHERGQVRGLSVKARSRMMKQFSMLKRHHIPVFVTLTYPDIFPETFEETKRHLDTFCKSLKYHYPDSGLLWRMEYQARGAYHYHMFIWGVDPAELAEFVPKTWDRIVNSGDENHLLWHEGKLGNQHCVQPVKSWHGVKSYASKYFGKLDERTELGGRIWGARGNVPYSELLQFKVDVSVALEFRRAMRSKHGMKFARLGFWCGNFHPDWLVWLDYAIKNYHDEQPPPDPPPAWMERRECVTAFDDVLDRTFNEVM